MVVVLKMRDYDPITVSQMGYPESAGSMRRRHYTVSAGR